MAEPRHHVLEQPPDVGAGLADQYLGHALIVGGERRYGV